MFSARNTYFSKKNLDISQHFVIFATEKYVLMTKYLLKISFLALMLLGTPVMLNAVPSIERPCQAHQLEFAQRMLHCEGGQCGAKDIGEISAYSQPLFGYSHL